MAEFQELIKNFDRIRDYMRQFFVYGYKSRSDYGEKSSRTYDNERRRIESWLSGYTQSAYAQKEKHVYISVDSKTIPQNPLYAAWKSKSFTDNDILLHFFLLDLLWENQEGMSAKTLCDCISMDYGVVFDSQTVRLKLKEYEELGVLSSHKDGKSLLYCLLPSPAKILETSDSAFHPSPPPSSSEIAASPWEQLLAAVTYFQEAAPFGFIGSTILDQENQSNEWFQFKHHFIVHTLEDGVLADVLTAIRQQKRISFENRSTRSGSLSLQQGVPLKIFVSTQIIKPAGAATATARSRTKSTFSLIVSPISLSTFGLRYGGSSIIYELLTPFKTVDVSSLEHAKVISIDTAIMASSIIADKKLLLTKNMDIIAIKSGNTPPTLRQLLSAFR